MVVLLIVRSWGLRLEGGGRDGTDTEVFLLLLLLLLGGRREKIMGVLVIVYVKLTIFLSLCLCLCNTKEVFNCIIVMRQKYLSIYLAPWAGLTYISPIFPFVKNPQIKF